MNYPVVKGTSYILVHAEDMVIHNGTTQTTERVINPDSEYLKKSYQTIYVVLKKQ